MTAFVLVMQLRGTWDSPLLKAFSQYPSFPLLCAISITVCPLRRHPPCATSPLPPPKIPTPFPLHTETSCLDPFVPRGSTAPRRSIAPLSVSAPLLQQASRSRSPFHLGTVRPSVISSFFLHDCMVFDETHV